MAMTHDCDNRLSTVTNGGVTTTFLYNYKGDRVKKTTGNSSTIYIGKLFECTDGVCVKHIFAGGQRIATKASATNLSYYHADHLGGLNRLTSATGTDQGKSAYYPFGEQWIDGATNYDYKFTSQEKDGESGLYYYVARYYDPVIGRFITPDSIVPSPGDPQSLIRSCVQDESIPKLKMPFRIDPFYPSIPQGERGYILLNANQYQSVFVLR